MSRRLDTTTVLLELLAHVCLSIPYFMKYFLGKSARHFFENMHHKISKKYLTFEIKLKMVHCEQSNVYYIKMAGKLAKLEFGDMYRLFLEI